MIASTPAQESAVSAALQTPSQVESIQTFQDKLAECRKIAANYRYLVQFRRTEDEKAEYTRLLTEKAKYARLILECLEKVEQLTEQNCSHFLEFPGVADGFLKIDLEHILELHRRSKDKYLFLGVIRYASEDAVEAFFNLTFSMEYFKKILSICQESSLRILIKWAPMLSKNKNFAEAFLQSPDSYDFVIRQYNEILEIAVAFPELYKQYISQNETLHSAMVTEYADLLIGDKDQVFTSEFSGFISFFIQSELKSMQSKGYLNPKILSRIISYIHEYGCEKLCSPKVDDILVKLSDDQAIESLCCLQFVKVLSQNEYESLLNRPGLAQKFLLKYQSKINDLLILNEASDSKHLIFYAFSKITDPKLALQFLCASPFQKLLEFVLNQESCVSSQLQYFFPHVDPAKLVELYLINEHDNGAYSQYILTSEFLIHLLHQFSGTDVEQYIFGALYDRIITDYAIAALDKTDAAGQSLLSLAQVLTLIFKRTDSFMINLYFNRVMAKLAVKCKRFSPEELKNAVKIVEENLHFLDKQRIFDFFKLFQNNEPLLIIQNSKVLPGFYLSFLKNVDKNSEKISQFKNMLMVFVKEHLNGNKQREYSQFKDDFNAVRACLLVVIFDENIADSCWVQSSLSTFRDLACDALVEAKVASLPPAEAIKFLEDEAKEPLFKEALEEKAYFINYPDNSSHTTVQDRIAKLIIRLKTQELQSSETVGANFQAVRKNP